MWIIFLCNNSYTYFEYPLHLHTIEKTDLSSQTNWNVYEFMEAVYIYNYITWLIYAISCNYFLSELRMSYLIRYQNIWENCITKSIIWSWKFINNTSNIRSCLQKLFLTRCKAVYIIRCQKLIHLWISLDKF